MTFIYSTAIKAAAYNNALAPELLASLILKESDGNQWAVRFEPSFYQNHIANKQTLDLPGYFPRHIPTEITERTLRAFSIGLCQIMVETARELGFTGQFATELFDVEVNLKFGSLYLARCISKAGSIPGGLLKYNGGGNKSYDQDILKLLSEEKWRILLI